MMGQQTGTFPGTPFPQWDVISSTICGFWTVCPLADHSMIQCSWCPHYNVVFWGSPRASDIGPIAQILGNQQESLARPGEFSSALFILFYTSGNTRWSQDLSHCPLEVSEWLRSSESWGLDHFTCRECSLWAQCGWASQVTTISGGLWKARWYTVQVFFVQTEMEECSFVCVF